MKSWIFIFSLLIILTPRLTWAYDWEQEEGGGEREIQINRNRNYVGGVDEEDLKVQKFLPTPSRSPETPQLVKRADVAPDEDEATDE